MTTKTTHPIWTRAVATVLLVGALTGLGVGVAAAESTSAPVGGTALEAGPDTTAAAADSPETETGMGTLSSRRITVYNNSSDTMKLVSVDGDKWFEGRPEDGSSIAPAGGSHVWELTYKYAKTNADTVVYDLYKRDGSKDGSVTLDLRVSSIGVWEPSVGSACKNISSVSGIKCFAGGDTVTLSNAI